MPSRRKLKKQIKNSTNEIIEEGFMESINGDAKEAEKMDKVIDDLIDYRIDLLSKVSNYPLNGKRSEVKQHFESLKKEMKNKNEEYSKKIGHVK